MNRASLVAWALLAAAFCARLDPVHRPLVADNQLYFYMAERAASGVPPHVSHVDSKNELGVLLAAAVIRAGRVVGVDDVLSSRAISIAFTAASVALVAELAALLAGGAAAGHVAALALLAVRGLPDHTAAGNNVKVFLVTFLLLAHVAMARPPQRFWWGRDALAGLAAGLAFLCWQPALLVVVAVAAEALVARGRGWRSMLVVLAAAGTPVAAYELYFALHGALAEQLHQAYVMTLGSVHQPGYLRRSIHFLLTEAGGPEAWPRLVPLSFAIVAAASLMAAVLAPRRAFTLLREKPGLLSFGLGAAGATAFTLYDHQGVPDLFFVDPYYAASCGILVVAVAGLVARLLPASAAAAARPTVPAAVAALSTMTLLALQMKLDDGNRRPDDYTLEDQRRAADIVRGYHEEFGEVWAYGAVHLLGLAHLDNHVPYGLFYDDVLSVLPIDSWLPLRDGRMPEIILHSRGRLPGAPKYLLADYVEITPAAFAAQSIMVWRRVAPQPGGLAIGDRRGIEERPRFDPPAPLPAKGPRWEKPWVPGKRPAPAQSPGIDLSGPQKR